MHIEGSPELLHILDLCSILLYIPSIMMAEYC